MAFWKLYYHLVWGTKDRRPFAEAYVNNQKQHHEKQTTNAWLERMSEADDGVINPLQDGVLRESGLIYEVGDEFPF